jgi:hypothetical protein
VTDYLATYPPVFTILKQNIQPDVS